MRALHAIAAALVLLAGGAAGESRAPLAEAGGLRVLDGYAISSGPNAPAGAAYMTIANDGDASDRLVAAESPAARRVGLHDHVLENGVARMVALPQGVQLPAGETVAFERGGLHVMLMGLTGPLVDGATVPITLVFEGAGALTIEFPVDRSRGAAGH
jgi:hypothetical protein